MNDLAVHIYERKGLLRSWRHVATYEWDGHQLGLDLIEDPGVRLGAELASRRSFIENWTIWGNARPGRRVEFTGLKPPPPPPPDPDAPVQRAPRNERWS